MIENKKNIFRKIVYYLLFNGDPHSRKILTFKSGKNIRMRIKFINYNYTNCLEIYDIV